MKSGRFINGWTIAATLLVIAIIAGSVIIVQKYSYNNQPVEITSAPPRAITGNIYIGGAVNNPGYYPVFAGDTLGDLVGAAGGLQAGATLDDIKLTIDESEEAPQKININRAEVWLLQALPGVGEVKAQAIINYRQQHGFFRDINELLNVPGFGDVSFDKIKDLITVGD